MPADNLPPGPGPAPRHGRRVAVLVIPFRRAGRWFCSAPRGLRVGVILVLVGGFASGTYYKLSYLKTRAREREVAAGWRDFGEAVRKADVPAMHHALDRVLAASPGDPGATRRRAALASGSADPDDPDLSAALVSFHARQQRLPEAAREARKVLTRYPKHWRSHCVLAHHAVEVDRDSGAARRWLEALPDADDPGTQLDTGGVLYALRLSEGLGCETGKLRGAICRRVLPLLQGVTAELDSPGAKAQLIECYLEPFADLANLTELARYWAPVSRLAESAVTEATAAGDVVVLERLGELGPRLLAALARLNDYERMPDDRFAGLTREVETRTRRAWEAVREKDPARPGAYCGLSLVAARGGDVRRGVETVLQGMAACGDRPELLDLLARLATATGNAEVALKVTWAAAEKAGTDPAKWCLAANTALATGGHPDSVLVACANARKSAPNHPWACRIEARLWLETGDPGKALLLLRSLGGPAPQVDPGLARLHARALVEAGASPRADDILNELEKAERGRRSAPVLGAAFLRGVLDAKPTLARAVWATERANRLLGGWPDDPATRRVLADALFRQSELGSPPWNQRLAREALHAYERLPPSAKNDPAVVTAGAGLHLRALNDPATASRTAAPLRDPANAPLLTPPQREILGAGYTATGKSGDAIPVLERAVRSPGTTAGCWVQLALAYHASRRPGDARAALARVLDFPTLSPREQAEWTLAKSICEQESP